MLTQKQKLENFFRKGGKLTSEIAARKYGITRLPARVAELRASGVPIYNNSGTYKFGLPKSVIAKAYERHGASLFA